MSRATALVAANWLEANLFTRDVAIIEVDEDTTQYDKGHIEGAIFLDWRRDLQDPIRRDFLDKAGFERLMSSRGIKETDTVVLYGGNNNWFAEYAFWYFKTYGHNDVRLLDGGRKKWELESRPLVHEPTVRATTAYVAGEPNRAIRAMRDEVVDAIGVAQIVDVRSPEEYSGRLLAPAHLPQEQSQRGGHIPTAINIPWSQSTRDDGTFHSDEELARVYDRLDSTRPTIAYCRIGERSAHTWFVLSELLDWQDVRNYDGSWTEWGSLVGAPIEIGTSRSLPRQQEEQPDVHCCRRFRAARLRSGAGIRTSA